MHHTRITTPDTSAGPSNGSAVGTLGYCAYDLLTKEEQLLIALDGQLQVDRIHRELLAQFTDWDRTHLTGLPDQRQP